MMPKFLLYISYKYGFPIVRPLQEEILKRGYEVAWFVEIEENKSFLEPNERLLTTVNEVITYRPDIVLVSSNVVPHFFSGIKVQLFHGFSVNKRSLNEGHFKIRGFFDLYCTQGPTSTSGFKAQQKKHSHFEVIETGWSKVDPLFPLKTKLKSATPTIMIASTFTKRLSLAVQDDVFNEIKRLSNTGKYKFIMVLHPKLPNAIKAKWKSLENKNFTYYNTTDLIPLFKNSDIMFADTTSAIQEFLLQQKPVVTYNHTFNHNYLINITTPNAIENAFTQALHPSLNLTKNIEAFIEQLHPYFDGKSSERVIDACVTFLHKDKRYLKKKPLNLIRKYKIRKRLGYFTFKSYSKAYTLEN